MDLSFPSWAVSRNFLLVLAGGLITLVVNLITHILRRRIKKNKLRIAILAELKAMNSLERFPDGWKMSERKTDNVIPTHDIVPATVYKSNADELGLLSEKERKAVIDCYSWGLQVKDQIKVTVDNRGQWSNSHFDEVNRAIKNLKRKRAVAIETLEDSSTQSFWTTLLEKLAQRWVQFWEMKVRS